jgi:predicted TPR repeat methyltransferase
MVDRARDKGTYDELHVGDIITWLNDVFIPSGRKAQLATAVEVLLYFSDLTVIFRATHASLMPGGLFVATTEALEPVEEEQRRAEAEGKTLNETKIRADQPFIRRYSARYTHRMSYLRATAEAVGFQVLHTVSNATLRIEYGKPALGHFLLLQRPHTSGSEGTKEANVVAADRSGTGSGTDSGASSGENLNGSSMAVAHETRRRQARVLSKKAKAIFSSSSGSAEEAVRFLEQALALTPESTSALNDLGVALLRVGRPKEAAAVFRRCLTQWGASVKDSNPGSERAAQRAARRIQRAEQNLRQAEQQISMMEDEL